MDEREFLSGVNRKDERAWKELYDCFYAPLCCYSARISKDGTEAEDVVQDCLVKLWHSEVKFEDMKVITSYLYRAVYRATLNAVRDRERDRRIHERWVEGLAEDEGRAAEMALEEEAITRFHKVLELLPGQQRDILLHCMKGEKVREIAEALGVSENTVKTQKKRAYLHPQWAREHESPLYVPAGTDGTAQAFAVAARKVLEGGLKSPLLEHFAKLMEVGRVKAPDIL